MVKVIFNSPVAYAMNNGTWSLPIYPTRACRQGCTYSPSIFVLTVEILGLAIRQNVQIQGIKLEEINQEIKSGQFADDLWSTLRNIESLNKLLQLLEEFYRFSGLRINSEKCVVLKIGPHADSDARYYTLKRLYWSPNKIRILGINIYNNYEDIIENNYCSTFEKMDGILSSWYNRNLTVIGKITVVNSLISSLFIHILMALPSPPSEFYKKYRSKILEFIWNKAPPKISYNKLIQHTTKLGLKLVDLECKEIALKAAFPPRWWSREDNLGWIYLSLPVKNKNIWTLNTTSSDIKWEVPPINPIPYIWKGMGVPSLLRRY